MGNSIDKEIVKSLERVKESDKIAKEARENLEALKLAKTMLRFSPENSMVDILFRSDLGSSISLMAGFSLDVSFKLNGNKFHLKSTTNNPNKRGAIIELLDDIHSQIAKKMTIEIAKEMDKWISII